MKFREQGMSKSAASLQPLYQQVKRHILDNIGSGKWGASTRVPSENDIVKSFGVLAHDGQPRPAGIAR